MVVRVATVAIEDIEARLADVQVQIANGNVDFTVVGLADKAVAESRESVRAAWPCHARARRRQSRARLSAEGRQPL